MEFDGRPHKMIYGRTGILSERTDLNQELADEFMRISALRRGIVFVDSGRNGLDPARKRSHLKRYHHTSLDRGVYMVRINEGAIDSDIKAQGVSIDSADYENRFVTRLRKEVKGAVNGILLREKFGFRDQAVNWGFELIAASYYLTPLFRWHNEPVPLPIGVAALFLAGHPLINYIIPKMFDKILPSDPETDPTHNIGKARPLSPEIFLPSLPIVPYIKSRKFLADHINELVVTKD